MNDTVSNQPIRASLHIGPVVAENVTVAWNPTIERIVVALSSDASLHLRPPAAMGLVDGLLDALVASGHLADAEQRMRGEMAAAYQAGYNAGRDDAQVAPGEYPHYLLDADTDEGGEER